MPTISVKFEYEVKNYNSGMRRLECKIGDQEVTARNKVDLADRAAGLIDSMSKDPIMSLVQVGDTTAVVITDHRGTRIYITDREHDGKQEQRMTTWSGGTHEENVDGMISHLFKWNWQPGDGVPPALPARFVLEFERWMLEVTAMYKERASAGLLSSR